VLSEIEPYVGTEQDFCAVFFHLRYPGDNKNVRIFFFFATIVFENYRDFTKSRLNLQLEYIR